MPFAIAPDSSSQLRTRVLTTKPPMLEIFVETTNGEHNIAVRVVDSKVCANLGKVIDEIDLACSELLNGAAYGWLLDNCQSFSLLENTDKALKGVADRMNETIERECATPPSSWDETRMIEMEFQVDWDLMGFLQDQNYGTSLEFALEDAITITGSLDGAAQALSCLDYMTQTWPSSGSHLMRILQKAVASETGKGEGKQTTRLWPLV